LVFTRFVEQGQGLFLVGCGDVTWGELYRANTRLGERADLLRNVAFAVVDFHETTNLDMTPGEIRQLAHQDVHLARWVRDASVAIVAPKDSLFGMARMWEVYVEATGWRTKVFRSSEEALPWVVQSNAVSGEA